MSHRGIAGSIYCWRPFYEHLIRRIFKPSFENPCLCYLIGIGKVPNKVFLSLFVNLGKLKTITKAARDTMV